MALDFSAGQLEFTVTNPTDTVTDFSFIVLLTRASHGVFFDACTVENAAQMRLCKGDETTELAFDPIDEDWTTDAESILLRVKWSGSLTNTGSYTLIALPALSTNTAYAATDTYGQYNAYAVDHSLPLTGDEQGRTYATSYSTTGVTTGQSGNLGDSSFFIPGSYIDIIDSIDYTSPWRVSGLVNLNSDTSDCGFFGTTNNSSAPVVWFDYNTTANMRATVYRSTALYSNVANAAGEWKHIAVEYDGSDVYIYINGSLDVQTTKAMGTSDLRLGGSLYTSKNPNQYMQHITVDEALAGADYLAYESSQLLDNSTFWGTAVWVPGDTGTAYTGGVEQSQDIGGALNVKLIFTGGVEQSQEISGAMLVRALFSGGIDQAQDIGGLIDIITQTAFEGGVIQTQTIAGAQKIVIPFSGGISQSQEVSGAIEIILEDTNFTGGAEQEQLISGYIQSLIEILPDIITCPGEIERTITVSGEIERTITIKGELV